MSALLKQQRKAAAKFKRIALLRVQGNAKDIKSVSNVWVKQVSNNVKGYWKPEHSAPSI